MTLVSFIFFFFSSRRRHTRYWRDWSSDVCSSDLKVRTRAMSNGVATPEPSNRMKVKTKRENRSEEHTSELQSRQYLVCRLLLEKKKNKIAQLEDYERGDKSCLPVHTRTRNTASV